MSDGRPRPPDAPISEHEATTAAAIHDQFGIPAATLYDWARDGLVRKFGRYLYSIRDVMGLYVLWLDEPMRAVRRGEGKHSGEQV